MRRGSDRIISSRCWCSRACGTKREKDRERERERKRGRERERGGEGERERKREGEREALVRGRVLSSHKYDTQHIPCTSLALGFDLFLHIGDYSIIFEVCHHCESLILVAPVLKGSWFRVWGIIIVGV